MAASLFAVHLLAAPPAAAEPQAGGDAAAAPSPADKQKAVELFKKALGLYKSDKLAEALPLFRESYGLVQSPNSQIYIARCLARTGDKVGAYNEFSALIADVEAGGDPKYQPTRDSAVQERNELTSKLALVTVSVAHAAPDTTVSVGGQNVPSDKWGTPMPFEPGSVDVLISSSTGAPQSKHVELSAGEKRTLELDANPTTTEEPPPSGGPLIPSKVRSIMRPASFALGGIGVIGLGMFAVGGGLANATYSDLESKCSGGSAPRACPPGTEGQISDGNLQKDIANAGLIIGAIGLATGVTLFVLSREPSSKDEGPQPEVEAVVGPSYLGVQGTF